MPLDVSRRCFRVPLTYEVFHFLTGEALVAAVKIYFTTENPSKEKFKLVAGKNNSELFFL
jgi:hypothetical protein